MSKVKPTAPRWADRVSKRKIARIYKDDAAGMHDEELIHDVAYMLWARCKSMLIVEDDRNGHTACPVCDPVVEHGAKEGCLLECENCAWSSPWDAQR